jgi:hypothetical protein
MNKENKDEKQGRVPNLAEQRRRDKTGQLQHNLEQPAEEGEPVNPLPHPAHDGKPEPETP